MVYEDDDEGEVKEDENITGDQTRKKKIVRGTVMKRMKNISKMKME